MILIVSVLERLYQLENNDIRAEILRVSDVRTEFRRFGIAAGKSTTLKTLELDGKAPGVKDEDLEVFFRYLSTNRSIENVVIGGDYLITPRQLPHLTSFFMTNKNLELLRIFKCDREQFTSRFHAVLCCPLLKRLMADCSGWDSNQVEVFSNSLLTLDKVEFKRVSNGEMLGSLIHKSASFKLIGNPKCELRWIRFDDSLTKTDIIDLAQILETNDKLKTLTAMNGFENLTASDWDPLLRVLRLFNHSFHALNGHCDSQSVPPSDEILSLLKMNQFFDKMSIQNRKALDYDFLALVPKFSRKQKPFGDEGIDVCLLPYVLSSIGTLRSVRDHRSDSCRFAALYHFVRNTTLVESSANGGKGCTQNDGKSADTAIVIDMEEGEDYLESDADSVYSKATTDGNEEYFSPIDAVHEQSGSSGGTKNSDIKIMAECMKEIDQIKEEIPSARQGLQEEQQHQLKPKQDLTARLAKLLDQVLAIDVKSLDRLVTTNNDQLKKDLRKARKYIERMKGEHRELKEENEMLREDNLVKYCGIEKLKKEISVYKELIS